MSYDELGSMQHRLELDGRERLLVSGVEEVERFDEEEIVMNTTAGTLVVGGSDLHIGKLNLRKLGAGAQFNQIFGYVFLQIVYHM